MLGNNINPAPRTFPPILIVHNKYRQRGGEESVVQAEVELLCSAEARIGTLIYDSQDQNQIERVKRRPNLLFFNKKVYQETRSIIQSQKIQIIHCHNLFPLLSTSIYSAARAEGVPIVQTIHNYRIACLNGLHQRHQTHCNLCSPGYHLPGMLLGCYRGSRTQSIAFGLAQTANSWRGVWQWPTTYIVPSAYVREQLIGWGISTNKIVVKPHFVSHDPGPRVSVGKQAIFVGRLSQEKGLDLLLDVWNADHMPLIIVGDGPLRAHLEQRVRDEQKTNVRLIGYQERENALRLIKESRYLILPSMWPEAFGLVLIEAYACGVPVIASGTGGIMDIVKNNVTGLLYTAGDRADLAAKLTEMEVDLPKNMAMSAAARQEYELHYSAQVQKDLLLAIYSEALIQSTNSPLNSVQQVNPVS
jgi:glycosyltransferase involved in cell wall biosynthesis